MPDLREAQHGELAGGEPPLEQLELGALDLPVADVRLDAVALCERSGELAQAPDALGEHDHLLLGGHAGERLCGDPAQQRQAVAAAAHRLLHEALADERLGERGLGVRQRLGVDRGVHVHPDVAQHDALDAGELGERPLEQLAAGLERLELAQDLEQPPVRFAAALADRVEQLGERGVGVERERLRGAHLRHPGLHVLAGDPDQVRAVVDAQPVGVDLVHQIAGLAGVQSLA